MSKTLQSLALALSFLAFASLTWAQNLPSAPISAGPSQRRTASLGLEEPHGFRQFISQGKLRLSLENAILLALANNTDIRIDQQKIAQAKYAIDAARAPFDPSLSANFSAERSTAPSYTQLQGASTLSTLNQTAQVGINQTLETGTNYQATLGVSKLSTNSSFNFFNPSDNGSLTLSFTQPLLRGRGLLPNRGPIRIAQRSLQESRATFRQQVSDIIQNVVGQYWGVVEARENLAVQRKSLDQAQESYAQDKRALQLGALPPLDIYQSEAQVASRRVGEIQAEYALKEAQDSFRRAVGADLDPNIRALDLDLTEPVEPKGKLLSMDMATALARALVNRPQLQALRLKLSNDDLSIRIDHNNLEPQLSLSGLYQSSGLGGNLIDNSFTPPLVLSSGGWPDALDQVFRFGFPTYEGSISLTFPIKNHRAEAALGNDLVSKRSDLYTYRQMRQAITQDVADSVHELEQAELSMEASKIALNLSQKNLQAQQRKYQLGAQTIFFVLDAQTQLAQAEQSLVQSEIGYQLAVTALHHSTGSLLDSFAVQIIRLAK